MSNSLDFCKRRTKECNFTVLPNASWSEEFLFQCFGVTGAIKEALIKIDKEPFRYKLESPSLNRSITMEIHYDPNAEFEYFTYERCKSDGTLLYLWEQQGTLLEKVLRFGTYNIKKFNGDFEDNVDYEFHYTLGNFVYTCEHSKKFRTDEKPWLLSRFTTFLPIKFEAILYRY